MEPVESVLQNIYQSNTYRKDYVSMMHQQSCIFVFVVCVIIPSSNWGTSPDVTTVFHTRAYGRFAEVQSHLRTKKLHRRKKLQHHFPMTQLKPFNCLNNSDDNDVKMDGSGLEVESIFKTLWFFNSFLNLVEV